MPRYVAYYQATASSSVVVEAIDEDAAMDAADAAFVAPYLCAQCAHGMDLGDWFPLEQEGIEELS